MESGTYDEMTKQTERFGGGVQIGRTTKGCATAAGTIATVEIVVAG